MTKLNGMYKGACKYELLNGVRCAGGMNYGRGGFNGYSWEQGPPVCVQKCLEGFHLECLDHPGWRFIPKFNRTNAKCVLATARLTPLLVELIGIESGV